jgi:inner membrane protein
MDNLTHSLVGIAAAKAGLEKLSPRATFLCVLAANAPDSDIVVLVFGDRWSFLEHHRGITHSIIGVLSLAIILPVLFYVCDLLLAKIRKRPKQVVFSGLLLSSLIVSATHPLLDWTNNYGIRFLLPWNHRWFYGDFVFIVDPFIWLILGSACFLLTSRTRVLKFIWLIIGAALTVLLMMNARSANLSHPWLIRGVWLVTLMTLIVLAWKQLGVRYGRPIAWAALSLVVVYWASLSVAHSFALSQATHQATALAPKNQSITRLAAMPTLANPFSWDCVFETNQATYRFNLILGESAVTDFVRYEKPTAELDAALKEISNDRRAQAFLGFARFPVAKLQDSDCTTQTLVQLADLRYTEPGSSRGTFSLQLPVDCPASLSSSR